MMESKVRGIRADEKTHERFKAIAEDFSNQGEALESLINAYELQKAKGAITNMQTDIEDFDAYLRGIQKSYLHVLELNQNTESRARLEFQQQLESKDRQIADLQQRVDDADLAAKNAKAETAAIKLTLDNQTAANAERVAALEDKLASADGKATALGLTVAAKETTIEILNGKLEQASKKLDQANAAIESVEELRADNEALHDSLTTSQAEVAALKERLAKQEEESQERLAKQAEEAKEHAKLAKERAAVETQSAVLAERSKAQDKVEGLTQRVGTLVQEKSDLTIKVSELEARIKELTAQLKNHNTEITRNNKV